MRRRLKGLVLVVPLALVMPSVLRSCHRGGDVRNASGGVVDNLLAIVFMVGVPLAIWGLTLLFGRSPDR